MCSGVYDSVAYLSHILKEALSQMGSQYPPELSAERPLLFDLRALTLYQKTGKLP